MVSLGPLAFVAPWVLVALVVVPLLWWLLKIVPPSPRLVRFPAIRLLFGLETDKRAAESTPPWLIALRIALATLLILAISHPLLNPSHRTIDDGNILIVIDDGWASAGDWLARLDTVEDILAVSERDRRSVMLLRTAPEDDGVPIDNSGLMAPDDARQILRAIQPRPWPTDRASAAAALDGIDDISSVYWITDGIEDGGTEDFVARLAEFGDVQVIESTMPGGALVLMPPHDEAGQLILEAHRSDTTFDQTIWVSATDEDDRLVVRQELTFAAGDTVTDAPLEVPAEMRNRIERLEIEDANTAAAVVLLDQRWKRLPVGLAAGGEIESDQPLLSPIFYLERALSPVAEVRTGTVASLLSRPPAVMMLANFGQIPVTERSQLESWIDDGGILIRFAGPEFAQDHDDLVPVELREGERAMGGAMSWTQPQRIAPFDPGSPFAGLDIQQDVLIDLQVLAQPTLDLGAKTWARLEDGTPLVTAERRGSGWLVLVHTSANTQWTNLPISILFVDMMRRIVDLSQGAGAELGDEPLPVISALNGFGVLGPAPPTAGAVAANEIDDTLAGPSHPPGIYGTQDLRRSLNLGAALDAPTPLAELPEGFTVTGFERHDEVDLRPWLFGLAGLLALLEIYASLALRGLVPGFGTGMRLAAVPLLFLFLLPADQAFAQPADDAIPAGVNDVRFGYVVTGNNQVDQVSHTGLAGLSSILRARTSVEPGEPVAVDLEEDELIFFPLVYWPITAEQPLLSDAARAKLDAYLRTGGILVVDTRDADEELQGVTGTGSNAARLQELLAGINVPALIRVPTNHVLTQAYYLLADFPGRWANGSVWVERHPGGVNDGVSAIIIGSNDWASAWALNDQMQPLFPVVPGGERQREMSFRFGVNLVMYAMTGNYKADSVHLPAILERLGQ